MFTFQGQTDLEHIFHLLASVLTAISFIFKNNIQQWGRVNDDEGHDDRLLTEASSERLKDSDCTATLREG